MSAQQFIVERLNEPPFNMRLTLVAFDEKSPFELLEIVNAIMAQLSTEHQIDLRDETPDATANRMTEFLRILNFKQQMDKQNFKQALLHGDPGIIYPILTWMLQRLPELQKRSYLARFLVNIEVPEHMFSDEEVGEVYQQLKDLQEEFKETHKTCARRRRLRARRAALSPRAYAARGGTRADAASPCAPPAGRRSSSRS